MATTTASQDSLNRRRALAMALQQMSMQPMESPRVKGARISPWEGVSKVGQALLAGYQNKQLDKEQAGLTQADDATRLAQAMWISQQAVPEAQGDTLPAAGGPLGPQGPGPQLSPAPQQISSRQDKVSALAIALSSPDPSVQQAGKSVMDAMLAGTREEKQQAAIAARQAAENAAQYQQSQDQQAAQQRFAMQQQDRALAQSRANQNIDPLSPEGIAAQRQIMTEKPAKEVTWEPDKVMVDGKGTAVLRDSKGNYIDANTRQPISGRITPYIAPPTPRQRGEITPTAEAGLIQNLNKQWEAASKDVQSLYRANTIMKTGMDAARRGDMNAGSQAVLVTFQKFLDPTSVVRESEYARSGQGQSMANRVRGWVDKLEQGGAGMTLDQLETFAKAGQEIADNLNKEGASLLSAEKERIKRTAERYDVPIETIIPDYKYQNPGGTAAPPTVAASGKAGIVIDPAGVEHQVSDVEAAIKLHPGTRRK